MKVEVHLNGEKYIDFENKTAAEEWIKNYNDNARYKRNFIIKELEIAESTLNKDFLDKIERETEIKDCKVREVLRRAEKIRLDVNGEVRRTHKTCVYCFNSPKIAGQAFTEYVCEFCGASGSHPNTATPKICKSCAEKYDCCVECLAKI
jgi:hypothetical protein